MTRHGSDTDLLRVFAARAQEVAAEVLVADSIDGLEELLGHVWATEASP